MSSIGRPLPPRRPQRRACAAPLLLSRRLDRALCRRRALRPGRRGCSSRRRGRSSSTHGRARDRRDRADLRHSRRIDRSFGRQSDQRRGGARLVHHAGPARDDAARGRGGACGLGRGRRHQRRAHLAAAGQSVDRDARRRPYPARSAVGELHQFCRLRAEGVSGGRLWRARRRALFGRSALFVLAILASFLLLGDEIRRASLCGRRQCRRRASCGHPHRSRHHRRARALQPVRRPDRPLSREPPAFRRAVGRARRRLRSRIDRRRGDRRNAARGRARRRLGDARRRPAVRGTRRLVQHARRLGLSEARAARRHRHRRGRRLHVPHRESHVA